MYAKQQQPNRWGQNFVGEFPGIAERSWIFSPQMMVPSGTIFSKATVLHELLICSTVHASMQPMRIPKSYMHVHSYPQQLAFWLHVA
jgi:hypothetical protein